MPDLSLTGLPSTSPLPGDFVEVRFAQGQALGALGAKKVLLLGHKTSGGSATADTEIVGPISDENEAINAFGTGSPLHRMVYTFLAESGGALGGLCELYALAVTEPTGTQATGDITFTTNPTAAGVATVHVAGVPYSYAYTASDTVTTVATGLRDAINADPRCPCTATNSSGVLTVTMRTDGPEGNGVRIRGAVTASTTMTVSPTASTALASGATATSYTNALATILGQRFDYIVPMAVDATALGAIGTQVTTQALPATGFRQQVIAAVQDTASNAVTLAQGRNNARVQIVNLEGHEAENCVLAAAVAAARVLNEVPDPSFNFDGYTLGTIKSPHSKSLWFTTTELTTMLNGGVTPIGVAPNGQPYISRSITTRCLDGSNPDYRVRDTVRVTVADRFAGDWVVKITTAGYSKITADPPANGQEPPAAFLTPRRGKSVVEQLVSDYVGNGWLDPAQEQVMISASSVAVNGTNPSAMDFRIPLYTANLLHQTRTLVAESSPAV